MKLRLRKNNIIADKTEEIFLRILLGFSRGLLIKARRLSYRLSKSVVCELRKKRSLKKTRLCIIEFVSYVFFW